MRKRILLASLIITLVGFALYSVVSASLSYRSLLDNTRGIVSAQINALDEERVGDGGADAALALSAELGGMRVTFMDGEGYVTGDSFGVQASSSTGFRA